MRPLLPLVGIGCAGATTDDTLPPESCDEIRAEWQAAYDALLAENTCDAAEDCHAPFGACVTQLGGCQEAVAITVTQDALGEVESGFIAEAEAAGCEPFEAVCDCYGGYGADCDGGTCVLTGPTYE